MPYWGWLCCSDSPLACEDSVGVSCLVFSTLPASGLASEDLQKPYHSHGRFSQPFLCFRASLWRFRQCVFLSLFNISCFRASLLRSRQGVFLSLFNILCFRASFWTFRRCLLNLFNIFCFQASLSILHQCVFSSLFNIFCFRASFLDAASVSHESFQHFLSLSNISCFRAGLRRFRRCVFLNFFNISCFWASFWSFRQRAFLRQISRPSHDFRG